MRDILRHNERGFTIIELMVGTALMTLLIAAIFAVMSTSMKVQQYGMAQQSNYTEIRRAMNTISNELLYSNVTSVNRSQISYTVGTDNRTISLGTGADANTIIIIRNTGMQRIGNGQVQSLSFTSSTNLITIDISMFTKTGNATSTINLRSSVWTGQI